MNTNKSTSLLMKTFLDIRELIQENIQAILIYSAYMDFFLDYNFLKNFEDNFHFKKDYQSLLLTCHSKLLKISFQVSLKNLDLNEYRIVIDEVVKKLVELQPNLSNIDINEFDEKILNLNDNIVTNFKDVLLNFGKLKIYLKALEYISIKEYNTIDFYYFSIANLILSLISDIMPTIIVFETIQENLEFLHHSNGKQIVSKEFSERYLSFSFYQTLKVLLDPSNLGVEKPSKKIQYSTGGVKEIKYRKIFEDLGSFTAYITVLGTVKHNFFRKHFYYWKTVSKLLFYILENNINTLKIFNFIYNNSLILQKGIQNLEK